MNTKQLLLLSVSVVMSMTVMTLTTSAFAKNGDSSSDSSGKFVVFFDKPTPSDQATIPHGVSQHKDSIDTTHFVGEVKNGGSTGIKFAQIIATVYDANNQTVGTGMTFTTPIDIPAGQSAPFDLTLQPTDLTNADKIKLHLDFQEE